MAVKVIKHGETKFKLICPVCGCEFEYEFEDLIECYLPGFKQIKCPDCGEWLTHKEGRSVRELNKDITWTFPKPGESVPCDKKDKWFYVDYPNPYTTWTTNGGMELDCDKCPNKPDPTKIVVGDTPCTWCRKNQPYCFTGDKFPADYKGGSYSVNPEDFKHVTYTNTNTKAPEFTTNYTIDTKVEK